MMRVLMVGPERAVFKSLEMFFTENKVTAEWADTGQKALDLLSETTFGLIVAHELLPDMTGRVFVEKVVYINAMMNCVVLSQLPHDQFHEAYEGLGVLMQLSLTPGRDEAQGILDYLNRLANLGSKAQPVAQAPAPKGESKK